MRSFLLAVLLVSASPGANAFAESTSTPPTFLCSVSYVYSGQGPTAPIMHGALESLQLKDTEYTYAVEANRTNPSVVMLIVMKNSDPHLPFASTTGHLHQSGDYLTLSVRKGDIDAAAGPKGPALTASSYKDDAALFQCSQF